MATDVFRASNSKIGTWLKCRFAYHLKYVEKLRRKRKARPLQFGSMVHDMLQAYIEGDDPFDVLAEYEKKQGKLFRTMVEEYGNIVDDVRIIMTEYFKHYDEKSLVYVRHGGKGAEHKFDIELKNGVHLVGKIDGVAKTPDKLKWIVEHKTFGSLPNEDHRWRNLQSAIYIRVNELVGWDPVDGILWDYIRSKAPTAPKVLKTGKMSQRGIDSLPLKVLETLKLEGLDPKKFSTLIKSAESNRNFYFKRTKNPKKKRVIDALWGDLLETTTEMMELHGKVKGKTIARHCDWCEFEPICRAQLQGSDVDYIKEKEYAIDKEDHSQDWEGAVTNE